MLFLLWFSTTVGEGRLWERLRIYSGKYLFNKSKFYLEKCLISSTFDTSINQYPKRDQEKNIHTCRSTQC